MEIDARSPQIIEALLAKRQILFQGDVDVGIQARITRLILYLNAIDDTPITLLIDSFGGETTTSLCICDALQQSRAEVRGVVVGDAVSAGFRILQSCHRRLAYPHARLMFHAPTAGSKRIDADGWADHVKLSQRLHEEQLKIYAERSKQSMKQLRKWSKMEKRFTADEALKAHFLDGLVRPPWR